MSVVHYIAIVEAGGGSGFSVFFPDLPGCASAGGTIEAAARNAAIALNLHIASLLEHGEALPEPSRFDRIARDPEVREVARILVRGAAAPRAERVNVSLSPPVLATLDALAAERDLDRSAMIATLVRAATARRRSGAPRRKAKRRA